jgi:hypothetical protein
MDKLTFKEWSIIADLETIAPLGEDFEFSMARGELKTAQAAIKRLMTKLNGEGNLEAWVQSKITKAAEYLDTVADHLSHGEDDTERMKEVKEELQSAKAREKAEQILRRGEGRPNQFYKNHDIKHLLGRTKKHPSQGYGLVDRDVLKQGQSRAPKHTHLQKGQNKELGVKSFSGSYGGVGTHGMPQKDTLPRGKGSKSARRAANLKKEEFEQILEGFKGHKSVEEIAKKHKVSPSVIQKQLEMGMKVEHEHTTDNDQAMDIALQHLDEVPNYYSKLKKVEKVNESLSPHEEATKRSSEKLKKEKKITTAPMMMPKNAVYRPKKDPIKDTSVKPKLEPKEEKKEKLTSLQAAKLRKLEREQKKRKTRKESVEILDADGNVFAQVDDIIKGSDYKFKSFTQPINEDAVEELESRLKKLDDTSYDSIDKLMRSIMKEHDMTAKELHNAFVKKHDKTPDEWIKDLKEEKRGLWANIHAKRKRGERPAKPGEKGYPKTLDIEEDLKQARKNVGASKCWAGKKVGNPPTKMKGGKEVPNCVPVSEESEQMRYCPKCKKNETAKECRYGEAYWKMFSLPPSLAPDPYDPNDIHPANEGVSFEIGSDHKKAQKQAKIRNLATGTSNPNEKAAALRKLSGPSLPLADSVIQPGQITNEDYQRIQSTGNVYTILFSWRGRPMMNLQLFFPNMKRPSKDEVKAQIEKFYPGAVILQWYPSPTDPSKPIVVIQGK